MKTVLFKPTSKVFEYFFILLTIGVILSLIVLYSKHVVDESKTVVDSAMAGNLVDVSFISNMFDSDQSKINTDLGSFLVWGVVQELKGTSFRLETRKNEERYLCVVNTEKCWHMVTK